MKKLINQFKNRTVWILCAVILAASIVFGFMCKPFFLNMINALTILSLLLLLFGFFRYSWMKGDLLLLSWRGSRKNGAYGNYRAEKIEERKDAGNPALYAGLLLLIPVTVLTIVYMA